MENFLRKLSDRARLEAAPDIDVVDTVMQIISTERTATLKVTSYDKPFVWMASLSTAAAVAIGTLAIYAYYVWSNPLTELSETIAWAL